MSVCVSVSEYVPGWPQGLQQGQLQAQQGPLPGHQHSVVWFECLWPLHTLQCSRHSKLMPQLTACCAQTELHLASFCAASQHSQYSQQWWLLAIAIAICQMSKHSNIR